MYIMYIVVSTFDLCTSSLHFRGVIASCRVPRMTIATTRVLDHGTRASLTVCTWNGFQKRVQQAEKDVLPLHWWRSLRRPETNLGRCERSEFSAWLKNGKQLKTGFVGELFWCSLQGFRWILFDFTDATVCALKRRRLKRSGTSLPWRSSDPCHPWIQKASHPMLCQTRSGQLGLGSNTMMSHAKQQKGHLAPNICSQQAHALKTVAESLLKSSVKKHKQHLQQVICDSVNWEKLIILWYLQWCFVSCFLLKVH